MVHTGEHVLKNVRRLLLTLESLRRQRRFDRFAKLQNNCSDGKIQ